MTPDQISSTVPDVNTINIAELIANGYEPTPVVGKRSIVTGWRDGKITPQRFADECFRHPDAKNIGLRTGRLSVVDNDLLNPKHAKRLNALAFEILGPTECTRIGAKPGGALLYRNETPIDKITVGDRLVEILGTGQQVVAYGIHPDAGRAYEWTGWMTPEGCPLEVLSAVTPAQLREFARRAAKLLIKLGYGDVRVTGPGFEDGTKTPSAKKGEPVSFAHLQELLGYADPDADRDTWRGVVAGVRACNVKDVLGDVVRDLVCAWSRGELGGNGRPSRYTGDDAVLAVWDSMPAKPNGVGYGSVLEAARRGGYVGAPARKSPGDVWGHLADKDAAPDVPPETDDDTDIRAKYRGVKPSEGAKRPKASFWDTAKTMPRYPGGSRIITAAHPSQHKTNLVAAKVLDAVLQHGAKAVFCAGEDADEFLTERLPAQCEARGIPIESLDGRVIVSEMCPQLTEPAEVDAFIAEYQDFKPDFVVIDTLSEAIPGMNENAPEVGSLLMKLAGRIRRAFNATVILIHHLGKDGTKGPRGTSVLPAGANAVWIISFDRERGVVKQWVDKMKRGRAKFAVLWGTRIFGETMTVVPFTGADAGKAFGSDIADPYKELPR
jgi:hypothetical protein